MTLFVLQSYVSSGFHAREHRLLPLVLGLIALNSFYRITYYVTGEAQTLRILTDLLAIHMLYLMIHYVGDFMKFQLKLRTEVILFCSLVLFNSMLIIRAAQRETYQDAFRIALLCYTGILLGLATYVRVKSEVSVWEGHVNDMLYLGMALPGVAMLFRAVTPKAEEFLVPGAFEISCLIVFYLMMTGRLSNVTNIIRENFYNISDIPTFLFDNRMRYRDANASARRWFPEIVGELTDDPQEYPFYTKMMRWSKDPDQDYVVQWKESYCRCQLHPVCSENVVRGYILTLLDITQQKKETVLMEDLKRKHCLNQEKYLKVFLDDGEVPMHNNAAEQSIRGFCIGKKNWVMIDTVAGAKSSAIIYSIAETAKANNLKPYEYFEYLLTEIPKHMEDKDYSFCEALLPWSPALPERCRKQGGISQHSKEQSLISKEHS